MVCNGAKSFLREILRRNKAGEARAGMGRATFGGMFASTLLTLFVAPVGYTLLDDLQEKLKNLLKNKRKKVE